MTGVPSTTVGSYRPRIRNCQKHASARSRRFVPADPDRDCRFCTSRPVNYERPSQHTSDGSINRYYDPATGQFLTRDPLVSATGQPYAYAADDPVNNTDPAGLCNAQGNGHAWDLFNPWSSNNPIRCSVEKHPNSITSKILERNPANVAITGYYNEWQSAENGCGWWANFSQNGTTAIAGAAGTIAIAGGISGALEANGYFTGNEIEIGNNFRISPLGNGNAEDPAARLPHYHWRAPDEFGNSPPGQGIGQHRPWQGGWFPW